MSQENVETCRRALDAFMRRDNETALALYDPDVELHGEIDDRVYRGLDGVREFFRDWLSTWESFESEAEEWIDSGDTVIVIVHDRARGRHSGVEVDRRRAHVWTLRDGKLFRLRILPTKAAALESVGLSE